MPDWLSSLPIETVRTLIAVDAVVGALVIVLLLLPYGVHARSRGRGDAVLGARVRLGAEFPAESGSIVDVSGELAPRTRTVAQTIDRGFVRAARTDLDASPLHVLAHHRSLSTRAKSAVGDDDDRSWPITPRMSAAAARAGTTVRADIVPETAHDRHTASHGLSRGLRQLVARWGMPS